MSTTSIRYDANYFCTVSVRCIWDFVDPFAWHYRKLVSTKQLYFFYNKYNIILYYIVNNITFICISTSAVVLISVDDNTVDGSCLVYYCLCCIPDLL